MTWNEARDEMLKRLHADGMSFGRIAKLIGDITKNAAIGRAYRLGLAARQGQTRSKADHHLNNYRPASPPRRRKYDDLSEHNRLLNAMAKTKPIDNKPNTGAVRLIDRTDKQCAYIEGNPNGADTLCCGQPVKWNSSYCEPHYARCWHKPPHRAKPRPNWSVGARV